MLSRKKEKEEEKEKRLLTNTYLRLLYTLVGAESGTI